MAVIMSTNSRGVLSTNRDCKALSTVTDRALIADISMMFRLSCCVALVDNCSVSPWFAQYVDHKSGTNLSLAASCSTLEI